jgi:L-lysine 6-transaminase
MVRATRYLEIYRDDNILDYVSNVAGPALLKGLGKIEADFSGKVANVRGKGLMCAFDIDTPENRAKFLASCARRKMLILPCGTHTVRFRPALNVPLEDIEKGLEIARKALDETFG